jgi:hypothetical protein
VIQGVVVEGLIHAVVEVGFDHLVDDKKQDTIDLAPVIAALDELNQHSRDIFVAISRPTQTAGEEMTDRNVTQSPKAGMTTPSVTRRRASNCIRTPSGTISMRLSRWRRVT